MDEVPMYYTEANGLPKPLNTGNTGIFFPGTRRILDLNGDGVSSEADKYYAASPLPVAHGGWINEISWKQFDLNVVFTYSLGRHIINNYKYSFAQPGNGPAPIMGDTRDFDAWTQADNKEHDFSKLQMYTELKNQFSGVYDTAIEKVHMLRLKQLTLGYNLDRQIAGKIGLSGTRLFMTMENLFLLTNYSGLDPEIVSIFSGLDALSSYPLPRKFTVGLTINF